MNRIKLGQGSETVDRLHAMAATYNGMGYEFWIEWQPEPNVKFELQAGFYLHAIYEYIKVDRSLTELSASWRNFKYGVWLGANYEAAALNLPRAVQRNRLAFGRPFQKV